MDYSVNPETIVNSVITSLVSKKHGSLTDRLWGKLLSRFPVMRADLAGIDCDTMCTDGKRIYYSPEFVRDICLDAIEENRANALADKLKFLFSHELMHIIYRNITPDKKDTTFAIPEPKDEAWKALMWMANISQDAIINARLRNEFGKEAFPSGFNKRDKDGNIIEECKFCFYEGDVEKSWTQVFTETCIQASKELAQELGEKIDTFPDGYYENILLFRKLFDKYKKEKNEQSPSDGSSGQQKGEQGETGQQEGEGKDRGKGQGGQGGKGEKGDRKSGSSGGSGSSGKKKKHESEGSGSSGKKKQQESQGSGGAREKVEKAAEKVLHGNTSMDDHEKINETPKDRATKAKIDRAMFDVKKEADRSAGSVAGNGSILITMAERYFRTKPEPWYVGISVLLKNKINEGPQIRERIPPTEMLTQVMTGNSVVQFDKKSRQLDIAFAVDTSGSMRDDEVLAGVLKILGYLERNIPKGSLGHRFIFAQVDAGIEEWREMRIPSREYHAFKKAIASEGFRRSGGGGTRFAPFFKKIAEMKKKPDAVVVFSDMQLFDYPDVEKACGKFHNNIVWLCSEESPPDEFYRHKVGRAYETSSLFEDMSISR
jgi:predicted metal-dependent peptidase